MWIAMGTSVITVDGIKCDPRFSFVIWFKYIKLQFETNVRLLGALLFCWYDVVDIF